MPWCPSCDRFLSPSTVQEDATCPSCGRPVDPGRAHTPGAPADDPGPVPWHLKLMLGAVVVYLGYRAFQGLEWVAQQL